MTAVARLKYARLSAQKARLVADQVRGLPVEQAVDVLRFSCKKAGGIIFKLLKSALANAEDVGMDIDELIVTTICVDNAPFYKRIKARAKGRSNRIKKQNCHITIEVDEK